MTAPAPAAPAAPSVPAPAPAATPSRRRPALIVVTAVVLLAAAGWAARWALVLRHQETTDNAYVQATTVQVTAQQAGTVLEVLADDTDTVQAGQLLLRLDPADAKLALARAEARLAQTLREVRTLVAQDAASNAQIALRSAEVARVRADLQRAQDDVTRRQPLLASGAVGAEEMQHAQAAVTAARSALAAAEAAAQAARQQAAASAALVAGTAVDQHPNVLQARAAVHEAELALQRTELRAPVGGQVARRSVQVGQRIAAGAPLMSVVALDGAWVDANFKEVQLRRMRIGQPVRLTADLYGSTVEFNGRITGLGAGTGSAFALLPAQNATGNWIKVVQRVPVRIALDPAQLAAHPLRVGLSMFATVDVDSEAGASVTAQR
ncbi:MAG: HlyD family efflux transporter periplasmic adaptor subunit [Burkholderiaceae bacterium]|nr:HlyD family efflux transporter periplasmic adaptor subunit [Burkholderiaceae bacterium]